MSDTSSYIELDVDTDYETIVASMLDYLVANNPAGWTPYEGHLEVLLCEVFSRLTSEQRDVMRLVAREIYRDYGRSMLSIPPIEEAPARARSTWTLNDALGHTIQQGTVVAYQLAADQPVYFQVENSVTVPPGVSATATGAVSITAIDGGTEANGLAAGTLTLVDSLAWVTSVTSTTVTSGGVDAETGDEYLSRLREELKLLSPRPIKPNDFAVLARRIPGVHRAFAIDGYDPNTSAYDQERLLSVALIDEAGEPVAEPVRQQVESYLDAQREINFTVFAIAPTVTEVDITAEVVKFPSADAQSVEEACIAALEQYLSPAKWNWSDWIWRNELIALLSEVEGVDRVVDITTPATDLVIAGPAPLAKSRTLDITVV